MIGTPRAILCIIALFVACTVVALADGSGTTTPDGFSIVGGTSNPTLRRNGNGENGASFAVPAP